MLLFGDAERYAAKPLVTVALREDLGRAGDITSAAFFAQDAAGSGRLVSRAEGVAAGLPVVEMLFQTLDPRVAVQFRCADGDRVEPGQVLAEAAGPVLSLLAGERAALNFLCHLSGIATLTRRFVDAVSGTRAKIYDTRKTLPGWRALAKYAVRAGGGQNHRIGLYDAVLIKDNHLAEWKRLGRGSVADAVQSARRGVPAGTVVEVEVDSLEQLADALRGGPDIVLLDNFPPERIAAAVGLRDASAPSVALEASGGVRLDNVRQYAEAGVERISVGALTHSAPVLDMALDF